MAISDEVVSALAHLRATTGRTDLCDLIANEFRVQDGLLSKQENTIGELWDENQRLRADLDVHLASKPQTLWQRIRGWIYLHPKP